LELKSPAIAVAGGDGDLEKPDQETAQIFLSECVPVPELHFAADLG